MKDLFLSVLEISLSTSAVILALLLFSQLLSKRYLTKWKYFIWIALALRLAVPVQLELPKVTTIPRQEIVFEMPARIAAPIVQNPAITVPTVQQAAPAPSVTPLDVIAAIWLVGCILFLLAHLGSYLVYRRRVMVYGHRTRDLDMLRMIRRESKDLGISAAVPVRTYAGASSPMILGFIRPILVLPDMKYRSEELEFILRHELIHLKRHDMFFKLLFVVANAVHWFNPVIYLMQKEAVLDMELSCDETVVENTGYENRKAYTETLLSTLCRQQMKTTALSSQFYGGKQVMKKRFKNILGRARKKNGKIILLIAVLVVILFGAIIRIRSVDENDLTPVGDDIFDGAWAFSEAFAAGDEEGMRACLDDTYTGTMVMYPDPISDPEEAKFKFSGMEDMPKFGDISNNSFLWPSVFDKTVPLGCTYTVKMRGNSAPDGEYLILSLINREDGWKVRDYTFEWGEPPAAEVSGREIDELLDEHGLDYYAYMDLSSAAEELKPVIIEARNRIILSSDWVEDGLDGRIKDEDGNVIETLPHFSDIFPSDWEIPTVTASAEEAAQREKDRLERALAGNKEFRKVQEAAIKFARAYFEGDLETTQDCRAYTDHDFGIYNGPAFDYNMAINQGFHFSPDIISYSLDNVGSVDPNKDISELYSMMTVFLDLKGTGAPEGADYFIVELTNQEEGWLVRDFGFGRVATEDDCLQIATLSDIFASAYFSGDSSGLKAYMSSFPSEYSDNKAYPGEVLSVGRTNGVPQAGSSLIVNDQVVTSVEFYEAESPDSYSYLTLEFIKQGPEWKINFYGVEK